MSQRGWRLGRVGPHRRAGRTPTRAWWIRAARSRARHPLTRALPPTATLLLIGVAIPFAFADVAPSWGGTAQHPASPFSPVVAPAAAPDLDRMANAAPGDDATGVEHATAPVDATAAQTTTETTAQTPTETAEGDAPTGTTNPAAEAGSSGAGSSDAGSPEAGSSAPGPSGLASTGTGSPGTGSPGTGSPGAGSPRTGAFQLAADAVPAPAAGARGVIDPHEPGLADTSIVPLVRPFATTNGAVRLEGKLYLPPGSGPFPAVVLAPSDGPNALERSLPDASLFAQAGVAAYAFAAAVPPSDAGVASLPAGRSVDDRIGDVVAAVKAVRRIEQVDPERVGVWGVGEGGWVLPFVGAQEDVAFLILVNTAVAPLGQLRMWQTGNAMREAGSPPGPIETTMRAMQLEQSARPILARVRALDLQETTARLADPPSVGSSDLTRSPSEALRDVQAPFLAIYDGNASAPVVQSAAALRRASRARDEPFDVVSVLDERGHAFDGPERAQDPAYETTIIAWTRTVLSGGSTLEPLDPEAVRGMTRGFAPVSADATASVRGGSATMQLVNATLTSGVGTVAETAGDRVASVAGTGSASGEPRGPGSGRWYAGADRPIAWYAGVWFQLPVLAFFVLVFTLGLVASLLPQRRLGGLRVTGGKPRFLRLIQGLVSFVDLALLAGLAWLVSGLLGFRDAAVPTLAIPLGEALRGLSVASGLLAVVLACLVAFGPATGWRWRRNGVALGVALAAALFLPYLVYWRVPFLAG